MKSRHITKIIFTLFVSIILFNCGGTHEIEVNILLPIDNNVISIYNQQGNYFYFSIYDHRTGSTYKVPFDGHEYEKIENDLNLPTGDYLTPGIEVFSPNNTSSPILIGEMISGETYNLDINYGPVFSVFEGEVVAVNILMRLP